MVKLIHSIMAFIGIFGLSEKMDKEKEDAKEPKDGVAKRVHEARGPVDDWAERPMNDSHRDRLMEIDGGWIVSVSNHFKEL